MPNFFYEQSSLSLKVKITLKTSFINLVQVKKIFSGCCLLAPRKISQQENPERHFPEWKDTESSIHRMINGMENKLVIYKLQVLSYEM